MSDDNSLRDAVIAELEWEPALAAEHVGVSVNGGIATLTGHVASLAEKHAAEAAASRVRDVRAVDERIEVRLPLESERSDAAIAGAALARLASDTRVAAERVSVAVRHGWVTLTGTLAAHYHRQAAEEAVRPLHGIVGVTNDIAIAPTVDVRDLSDDITHALHRSWFFDPKLIRVTAEGGKVQLTGTVHFARDRQLAAATAWSAPGVTEVRNDITVG